jgi:uncharacterized membrane protein
MLFAQRRLYRAIDQDRIRKAIDEAERRTSGEIRVSIAPFFLGGVEAAARRTFRRLGMERTRDRNAILFFFVPSRRRFAVIGDEGIHARVGSDFWPTVVEAVARRFRKAEYTEGLVEGIETVGRELAVHFPFQPETDVNELPNDVDFGRRD